MASFEPDLDALRAAVDDELGATLADRERALPDARPLLDEIRRIVAAGGKRLRPCFCYWGFRAAGGRHGPAVVRAAAALELLHTFAVVHDDIMDRSPERRGVPSVHAAHGLDVALLVGDLALVLADHCLMGSGFSPAEVSRAFVSYSRMRQEVIAGQYLDVVAARRAEVSESEARRIAVLKSGRYSVEEPLAIGAALAGADDGLLGDLAGFGRPLGEAFQLRDDLLGIFGRRSDTGKSVDSDIKEGKRNLLYAKTLGATAGEDRAFFARRWGGRGLDAREIDRLRDLVEASGARADTEDLLIRLTGEARGALDRLPVPSDARAALDALATLATERTA